MKPSLKQYNVIDIETDGLEIDSKINFVGILSFTSGGDPGDYYIYDMSKDKEKCIDHLKEIKKFIGHNAKFDAKLIKYNLGVDLKIWHDTMYLCYSCSTVHDMNMNRGKWLGLKYAAMRDLGVKSWDIDLESKKSIDRSKVGEYLKHDLLYTRGLFEHYKDIIDERDIPSYELMIKAANVYVDVECNGIPINIDELNKVMSNYNVELINLNKELKKFADINYNSSKQLSKLLYEDLGLTSGVITSTGAKSTNNEAMVQMSGQHEIIDLIMERKRVEKAMTFLKDWKQREKKGRIYCNFNLHTTVTGRTSSSNPNIQQVPRNKELKSVYQSPDGWKFVQVDYSQVELRTAGEVAHVKAMKEAYINGEDLHTNMASIITGKKKEDIDKAERTGAKAANFGYLYGMMPKTFVQYAKATYGIAVSIEEATRIRNRFFDTNSELLTYYKNVERELLLEGFVTNMFGRRYRVGYDNIKNEQNRRTYVRKAINFVVQSTASDYVLMSLIELGNKGWDNVKIVGSVHDSILFEVKDDDRAYQTLEEIRNIMEKPKLLDKYLGKSFDIPIVVDIEEGPWGKGVEVKRK